MRPGRARPRAALGALAAWLAGTGLWIALGPRGFLPLLVVAGLYLVGPLWVPARYRVDDEGVTRATAFGTRTWPWDRLGGFRLDAARRTAWLDVRGRGQARFLPPVLLLWEPAQGEGFATALAARLEARLGPAGAARAGKRS